MECVRSDGIIVQGKVVDAQTDVQTDAQTDEQTKFKIIISLG